MQRNDLAFGFHKVAKYYYAPGIHEPGPAGCLTVNRDAFDALPRDLQAIVQRAAGDEAFRMLAEMTAGNGAALQALIDKHGVALRRFPDAVFAAMRDAANAVVSEAAATDDISRRIFESWSSFRGQAIALAPLTELGYMSIRSG